MKPVSNSKQFLTFTGVRGSFSTVRISEESLLTGLTVAAFCVVVAFITHTTTPPPRCEPQTTTEVTALGMTVTLALWVEKDT